MPKKCEGKVNKEHDENVVQNYQPQREKEMNMATTGEMDAGRTFLYEVVDGMLRADGDGLQGGVARGLNNLSAMVPFNPKGGSPTPVPGMGGMEPGAIGFRRNGNNLSVAIVGGLSPVRYIPLDKLILLVERMHDPDRQTIILQNCSEGSDGNGRGQVLAKINPNHSALQVVVGAASRIIRRREDIVRQDSYYIDRDQLTSYYLAAKTQIRGANQLEELIQANEGWREFNIPTNPLDPFGV